MKSLVHGIEKKTVEKNRNNFKDMREGELSLASIFHCFLSSSLSAKEQLVHVINGGESQA